MSSPNIILGYTDKETVKLDFDNATFKTVKYWATRACNWFDLEGFLILKSSKNNYHVIFNRSVSWYENLHIVAWVALESRNKGLHDWLVMQCIKEASTLRISSKNNKSAPRIVYRYGLDNKEIWYYLIFRKIIYKLCKKKN